jgi:hypothetical protein
MVSMDVSLIVLYGCRAVMSYLDRYPRKQHSLGFSWPPGAGIERNILSVLFFHTL